PRPAPVALPVLCWRSRTFTGGFFALANPSPGRRLPPEHPHKDHVGGHKKHQSACQDHGSSAFSNAPHAARCVTCRITSDPGPWSQRDSELLDKFQFSPHNSNFSDLASREAKHVDLRHVDGLAGWFPWSIGPVAQNVVKDSPMGAGKSGPGDHVIVLCHESQDVIREVGESSVPIRNPPLHSGTERSPAPDDTARRNVILDGVGVPLVPSLLEEPAHQSLILFDGHCHLPHRLWRRPQL